jgi:hypothetical protein
MKTIEELLLEIKNHPEWEDAKTLLHLSAFITKHPEYFTHIIWDKEQIYEMVLLDFDLAPTDANFKYVESLLDDEEKEAIEDWIHNTIDYNFEEISEYQYSQEFTKRIIRHGIINSILPNDDIFDGGIGNI